MTLSVDWLDAPSAEGLGRWMKAANGLRLLDERPESRVIQTFNAGSNEATLAINRENGVSDGGRVAGMATQALRDLGVEDS
jgi:hypothetical protein